MEAGSSLTLATSYGTIIQTFLVGLNSSNVDDELACRLSFPAAGGIGYIYVGGKLAGIGSAFDDDAAIFKTEARFKFSKTDYQIIQVYGYAAQPRSLKLDECLKPINGYAIGYQINVLIYSPIEKIAISDAIGPIPSTESLRCPSNCNGTCDSQGYCYNCDANRAGDHCINNKDGSCYEHISKSELFYYSDKNSMTAPTCFSKQKLVYLLNGWNFIISTYYYNVIPYCCNNEFNLVIGFQRGAAHNFQQLWIPFQPETTIRVYKTSQSLESFNGL